MKKIIFFTFFFTLVLALVSVTKFNQKKNTEKFICINTQKTFSAGKPIVIQFKGNFEKKPQLFIIHSLGKTLLDGVFKNGKITYQLPDNFSRKTGLFSWFLIENQKEKIKGKFQILPSEKSKTKLESYLGPPGTLVGDSHFVMFVTIPTDGFDNPKKDSTDVTIKHQFLQAITSENLKTNHFIAWKNIFAPTQSGDVLIAASCNNAITKEFDAIIYPSIPTDFNISYHRNHDFADGNQITTLKTTTLKDKFGNIVNNGTKVEFIIKNKENIILKTFGNTINGIASSEIIHPEREENYTISAFVNGICKSNTIQIKYQSINPNFSCSFSKNKRTLQVQQIKSFMNQQIPDGIKVKLKIYYQNQLIDQIIQNSNKGKAIFYLSPDFYPKNKYHFEISTLGKTIKTKEINVNY